MANHTASLPHDKQITASVSDACASVILRIVLDGNLKGWGYCIINSKMLELRELSL